MLAEFVEKLEEMAVNTSGVVRISTHENLPESLFVACGGSYEMIKVPPPRRACLVDGFDDVVEAVLDADMSARPEVWCGTDSIVVLLDRGDRRDSVALPLRYSSRWATLHGLAEKSFTIPGVVKLLRFDLHGAGVDAVLAALSRVDFQRSSTGAASVEHGRESLGRSVEAAVQQVDRIPEEFAVTVPVWTNDGLVGPSTVNVPCGVYLDLQNERVEIQPLADQLTLALNAAQEEIAKRLVKALPGIPVFRGTP